MLEAKGRKGDGHHVKIGAPQRHMMSFKNRNNQTATGISKHISSDQPDSNVQEEKAVCPTPDEKFFLFNVDPSNQNLGNVSPEFLPLIQGLMKSSSTSTTRAQKQLQTRGQKDLSWCHHG